MKNKYVQPNIIPTSEWARLPGVGERLEGFCRGELYNLMRAGKIRSKVLKKPGKERGIRLIHVPSVRDYIEQNGEETVPEGNLSE
jgi:hypothetical protein